MKKIDFSKLLHNPKILEDCEKNSIIILKEKKPLAIIISYDEYKKIEEIIQLGLEHLLIKELEKDVKKN